MGAVTAQQQVELVMLGAFQGLVEVFEGHGLDVGLAEKCPGGTAGDIPVDTHPENRGVGVGKGQGAGDDHQQREQKRPGHRALVPVILLVAGHEDGEELFHGGLGSGSVAQHVAGEFNEKILQGRVAYPEGGEIDLLGDELLQGGFHRGGADLQLAVALRHLSG